jgi:hypothetical protein
MRCKIVCNDRQIELCYEKAEVYLERRCFTPPRIHRLRRENLDTIMITPPFNAAVRREAKLLAGMVLYRTKQYVRTADRAVSQGFESNTGFRTVTAMAHPGFKAG